MSDFRAIGDIGLLRFHRSFYASLALSCACLVYAEWPFMPEMTILAALAGMALFVAYRIEGRWSLSLTAANFVGGVIALAVMGWIAYQVTHPVSGLLKYLPWPASLLPYLGPLVLVIIPAKLFRPKHVGDYWGLQFTGLMGVGLACALGGDGIICLMTLAYACVAARCLIDFHAVADRVQSPRQTRGNDDIGPGILRTTAMTLPIAVTALGLSMATPRISDAKWEYTGITSRIETGYSDERPAIDLNISGELKVSDEEAFKVRVETGIGKPKLDLSLAQRWRGTTFNFYDRGKWQNRNWATYNDQKRMGRMVLPEPGRVAPFVRPRLPKRGEPKLSLPDLAANQFYITFQYPTKLNQSFFVAEPLWAPLGERDGRMYRAPLETIGENDIRHAWVAQQEGDVFPPMISALPSHAEYRQVLAPLPEADVGLPVYIDPALEDHLTVVHRLPKLRQFSDDLLRDLIAKGRIKWTGDPPEAGKKHPPEMHEPIARAFDSYLRTSGDFKYSFTLDRNDAELDPVEDFVLNLKQGHCNRFATALALLLRCQGVPTRMVMGFHGAESQGNGTYVVRHHNAHSWVEAVIRRNAANGKTSWHWLTLDPTPENPMQYAGESWFIRLYESITNNGSNFIRNYLLDFNSDRQRSFGEWIGYYDPRDWSQGGAVRFAGCVGMIGIGILVARVFNRRRRPDREVKTIYGDLVGILQRKTTLSPKPSWTPAELLQQFRHIKPDIGALEAAQRIVDRHYAIRFGGGEPSKSDAVDLKIVRRHLAERR